ncbi:hypothetical protein LIER_27549 [Lithospermum erythrorhizon]|uniref:Bet v I/Major latex protein domain-containing protein n=1 Tax=Lithospermum erythrorhizon TaxID=34254 RepID=A0AAV3RFV1_LITER
MDPDYVNKTIKFTLLEGDLMDEFKTFVVTILVDTHGILHNTVTWNAAFEKMNEDIQNPLTLMDFFEGMTNDVAAQIPALLSSSAIAVDH